MMLSICGIPRITLRGTPDDWRSIRQRARRFDEFGLRERGDVVASILGQFVAAPEADT